MKGEPLKIENSIKQIKVVFFLFLFLYLFQKYIYQNMYKYHDFESIFHPKIKIKNGYNSMISPSSLLLLSLT